METFFSYRLEEPIIQDSVPMRMKAVHVLLNDIDWKMARVDSRVPTTMVVQVPFTTSEVYDDLPTPTRDRLKAAAIKEAERRMGFDVIKADCYLEI